ncbi:MAG: PAS domain S-box protein [Verrucomicrobiales bacterium]|nr:PAS domain S-box protein [Verrucomicrobiales bacterium]
MNREPNIPAAAAELRRRAKARLRGQRKGQPSKAGIQKSAADTERVVHELEVHRIELEMQNEELQEARNRMEVLLEKYTDLYDFAPVGYFSLDEQGRILEVNLTGAALLGVERSRLINRRLPVAPASQRVFLAFLKRVFAGAGKQVCEAELLKQDAAAFWASFHGISALSLSGPVKWCRVAVSDITPLKQAEELLRRNEALFSALIQQAPVGVYIVDEQLRLQQVNLKARPVFSKIHPLKGRDFSEIIHILWPEKIADEIMERFRHTLKTGQTYYSPEFSERRRDLGVTKSYEWQLQRITLPAGHHGVVCFFNDITERKQAEATQRRIEALAASNRKLEQEIVRRQAVEEALKNSEQHQSRLLEGARHMQEQLRHLSRQILQAQEQERKRISRELHDEIVQTLTGINVRLASLKAEATFNIKGLQKKITSTQRLVEKSVDIVHRFARELRPTLLDDLGLIPALHSFMKSFTTRTGVRTRLTAFAAVEQLDGTKRTVLYRVAQEALTNVGRHAQASQAQVRIQILDGAICMEIKDNVKGFQVDPVLHVKKNRRLGLLGMRERVEMIGGNITIKSAPAKGTAILARIPLAIGRLRGGGTR